MTVLKGKGVSKGVAIGPLYFYKRTQFQVEKLSNISAEEELTRFHTARGQAAAQLGVLSIELAKKIGKENSLLFEIHKMMLEDIDYSNSIVRFISEDHFTAEYAVLETAKIFAAMFSDMDDDYMKERATDVQDVSRQVVEILTGAQNDNSQNIEPSILISDDFVPSETAQFNKNMALALVTAKGSSNSHTAIFARTMGIPAVIGLGELLLPSMEGLLGIVDGSFGKVIVDPDDKTLEQYSKQKADSDLSATLLQRLKGKPNQTLDGQVIDVYVNIGGIKDLDSVLENDAGGIGLFRSEFLYLQSQNFPTEEAQFLAYKTVLEFMSPRRVIVRTLDIGADKKIDYFHFDAEENPALGYRGIRICLDRPEIFKTQLRALLRASVYGKLAIMLPMITSVSEVVRSKAVLKEVQDTLRANGIAFCRDIEVGIMIETPAAAMISDKLAKEVDFFSVGTNDLTQYSLAIDRQNQKLEQFYNPHHIGLLRMIKMATDNIHKENKWIGICGELGADLELTELFLAMGVDELSVTPNSTLALREKIRSIDLSGRKEEILSVLL